MPKAKALRGFYDQNCVPRDVAPNATFEASAATIRELQARGVVAGGSTAAAAPKRKKAPEPLNKAAPAAVTKSQPEPDKEARLRSEAGLQV